MNYIKTRNINTISARLRPSGVTRHVHLWAPSPAPPQAPIAVQLPEGLTKSALEETAWGKWGNLLLHWLAMKKNAAFPFAPPQPHPALEEAAEGQGGEQCPAPLACDGKEPCLLSCQRK